MRALSLSLLALVLLSGGIARADEHESERQIDWRYDFGLTLPRTGRFPHRFLFRWETESYDRGADVFTVQYGRGWRWNEHLLFKASLGWAGTTFDGSSGRNELALTLSKDMRWDRDRMRLTMEGSHYLGGDGYRYRGYYAFDWWFAGVHVSQADKDTMWGFQVTSGPNAEFPLRVEARHSFELFGDAPAHVTRIVVIMDTD